MVTFRQDTTRDEPRADRSGTNPTTSLYFFPEHQISAAGLRTLLREGTASERAWAVSHLLRYARWDDIWTFVERDEVRELLPDLDLPEKLRHGWAKILEIGIRRA